MVAKDIGERKCHFLAQTQSFGSLAGRFLALLLVSSILSLFELFNRAHRQKKLRNNGKII
jgi:hypothetical protein